MKPALFVVLALAVLIGRALAAEGPALEEQFRADAKALIHSKAQQPVQAEAQEKLVDQMVADVKKSFPSVLIEATKEPAPTDEALRSALAALDRIGAGAPRPVLISYYADLWKSERIEPRQRIIFERLAHAITQAAESRKKNAQPGATAATPLISPSSLMISPLNMAQSFKRDGAPARRAWLI